MKIYGFPRFETQYALENFADAGDKWNKSHIRVFNIDIEVTSTEGFPEANKAAYPVTAICIHDSKTDKFVTFGHGEWLEGKSELPEDTKGFQEKINPTTGVVLTKNGEVIYRKSIVVTDDTCDVLISHDKDSAPVTSKATASATTKVF